MDAEAIELNLYEVATDPRVNAAELEERYLDLIAAVKAVVRIPLAVKLSPYFSSVANLSRQLVEAGAQALVLFNRFYQPDLDLDTMEVTPRLVLSSSEELRLPLRWIAILPEGCPPPWPPRPGCTPPRTWSRCCSPGPSKRR